MTSRFFTLLILFVLFLSCKKGTQSFWYNETVAETLFNNRVRTLSLYVDGEQIHTIYTGGFYSSPPDCEDGHFVFEDRMYRNETATHSYHIINNLGDTMWKGNFTTRESVCNGMQLVHY